MGWRIAWPQPRYLPPGLIVVIWNRKSLSVARWLVAMPLALTLIFGLVQRSTHRHGLPGDARCGVRQDHACGAHGATVDTDDSSDGHGEPAEHDSSCAVCHWLAQTANSDFARVELPLVAPVWEEALARRPAIPATRYVAFYLSRAPPLLPSSRSLV